MNTQHLALSILLGVLLATTIGRAAIAAPEYSSVPSSCEWTGDLRCAITVRSLDLNLSDLQEADSMINAPSASLSLGNGRTIGCSMWGSGCAHPAYFQSKAECLAWLRNGYEGRTFNSMTVNGSASRTMRAKCPSSAYKAFSVSITWAGGGTPPPDPSASCKIISPITLSHGSVSSEKIDGNTASSTFGVECNKETDILLKIPESGIIALKRNNSLKSTVLLDGMKGGNVRVRKVGPGVKYITVSSVLSSLGEIEGGQFSGSGILSLEIP